MKYSVTGANKETGEDVQIVLTATSRHEAEQAAVRQGIMVAEIKLLMEEKDTSALSMDDDGPGEDGGEGDTGYWKEAKSKEGGGKESHGTITMSANSPSGTASTGAAGQMQGQAKAGGMEYHIIMNQAMYLLETAVNKFLADGWEPAGGLTVGISNNAMQYFQAVKRKRKEGGEGQEEPKH
ncbi:MAG: hypothetical protein FWD61_05355 [Phycisphaerales bacterium]|nr:hypothetical protein [Phycisphaerales bacterium]